MYNFAKLSSEERLSIVSELEAAKLIKVNRSGLFNNEPAWVLKYAKSVFWEARWNESPWLVEMRGTVITEKGRILALPFTKVFNRGEKCAPDLMPWTPVRYVLKINGFMAGLTVVDGAALVSTTGSINSDFVELAKTAIGNELINQVINTPHLHNLTLLFEVCDPTDPHIINEKSGIYLIGARDIATGNTKSEDELDKIAWVLGDKVNRPYHQVASLQHVIQLAGNDTVEGYMVYSLDGSATLKLKTSFYLVSKFLARGKKSEMIWKNKKQAYAFFDEEFYGLIDKLEQTTSLEDWQSRTEQQKLELINELLQDLE